MALHPSEGSVTDPPLCECGLPVHLLASSDRTEAPVGYCGVTLALTPVVVTTQCVTYSFEPAA